MTDDDAVPVPPWQEVAEGFWMRHATSSEIELAGLNAQLARIRERHRAELLAAYERLEWGTPDELVEN